MIDWDHWLFVFLLFAGSGLLIYKTDDPFASYLAVLLYFFGAVLWVVRSDHR